MAENVMPAAEAPVADASSADERGSYELAFHVLPTVAEGEVSGVFESLKELITKKEAEIFDEEAPERFDLAYEIVQHIEGKNRKFSSAYFGWVRFKVASEKIAALTSDVEAKPEILRYLLIKLTKVEEANPFRFHESLAADKMVTTVEESKVMPDVTSDTVAETTAEKKTEDESEEGEVDEEALDEALESKEL